MINLATAPRFRLQDVCSICGVNERRMRNCLDRKQLTLDADSERKEGSATHRRFSVFDLVRIAIFLYLVDYGASIEEANRVAAEIVERHLGSIDRYSYTKFSKATLTTVFAGLRGRTIAVWRNTPHIDDTWQWEPYSDARAETEGVVLRMDIERLGQMISNSIIGNAENNPS